MLNRLAEFNKTHISVGAIIIRKNKILLLDRAIKPFGFACPAGHAEKDEIPEEAVTREVKEETDLDVINIELVAQEIVDLVKCHYGVKDHKWFIFKCRVKGKIKKNRESKLLKWYNLNDIDKLNFEPSWKYWLRKLKLI